ncbi:reverse transcriptase domain-containing protein [Tanacetum coccineum]
MTSSSGNVAPEKHRYQRISPSKCLQKEGEKVVTRRVGTGKEGLKSGSIWKLYTDEASSFDGLGAGLMLISPEGRKYTYALSFEFETTNNEAEYEALLAGLRIAQEMEIKCLTIFTDSQIMSNQIKGIFETRQPTIKQYLEKVKEVLKEVLVEVLTKRSINDKEVSKVKAEKGENRMTPIYEYLLRCLLSEDPKEARKIIIKAPQYKLIKGGLYKRSYLTLWLQCVGPSQSDNIIKEVHEGSCGFNMEPRSMVVRVMKQGYYWPLMHRDATKIIQDCTQCQEYSMLRKVPSKDAISSGNSWLFSYWFGVPKAITSKDDNQFREEAIISSAASLILVSKGHSSKDKRKEAEGREVASIKEAYYQNKLRRYYNTRSSHFRFKLGEFVLLL